MLCTGACRLVCSSTLQKFSVAYELKTKKNKARVADYIKSIKDPVRQKDAKEVHKIMKELTGSRGTMWGKSIVGYGTYNYKYPSGQEGEWMCTGWSSRVQNLTLYIMPGYRFDEMKKLLGKLGPHKLGRSCLYIKRLDDIHMPTLKKIIKEGILYMKKTYETKGLK